jgi:DNA-binding Xre family transcriptional regulator
MGKRQLKNRLMELIQERERKLGYRLKQHDIAQAISVTDHTIASWIRNEVTRFDKHVVEGLCEYFDCELNELLYFESTDNDKTK